MPREWRQRAEAGDPEAQYNLAVIQDIGRRGAPNHAEAARCYRLAAEQGHVGAQHGLAYLYRVGRGVPRDEAEAVRWYEKAAAQGHAEAQFALGEIRAAAGDGRGAAAWFGKAAERGHAHAQYRLALMLTEGQGANPARALAWAGRAAAQGLPEAQFWLGRQYDLGEKLPRDPVEAHRWLSLSAAALPQGEARKQAEERVRCLQSVMTRAQRVESDRLVRSFLPRP